MWRDIMELDMRENYVIISENKRNNTTMQQVGNNSVTLPPIQDNKKTKLSKKKFADNWLKRRGAERQEAHAFSDYMLTEVIGVRHAYKYACFEERVGRKFIDISVDRNEVGVYIEQDCSDVGLDTRQRRSDDSMFTFYELFGNYFSPFRCSRRARWVIECKFREFRIHDIGSAKSE